jgi:hypothetical protein
MNEQGDAIDQMRLFLPRYLTAERQQDLRRELKAFPNNKTIYTAQNIDAEILQGDGWRGFIAIDFHSRQGKSVSGIVVSNSCDIDRANPRTLLPNVLFAPLIKMSTFLRHVQASGKDSAQQENIALSIQLQQVTSLMYLPAIQGEFEESVARLDDIRGHPFEDFHGRDRSRIFRLTDFGFYLFLFKLSLHFTRMQEGVQR